MSEPLYIAQTAEPMTAEERWNWWQARARDAHEVGAFWRRMTIHETIPHLNLIEAWAEQPDDPGEPRFQFSAPSAAPK